MPTRLANRQLCEWSLNTDISFIYFWHHVLALNRRTRDCYHLHHDLRPDYPLCRLYHGRGPRREGARSTANFFHSNLTFKRLKVQCRIKLITTTKKVVNFFGGRKVAPEKAPAEKILATRIRKGPLPLWGPEWLIRPCHDRHLLSPKSNTYFTVSRSIETSCDLCTAVRVRCSC